MSEIDFKVIDPEWHKEMMGRTKQELIWKVNDLITKNEDLKDCLTQIKREAMSENLPEHDEILTMIEEALKKFD